MSEPVDHRDEDAGGCRDDAESIARHLGVTERDGGRFDLERAEAKAVLIQHHFLVVTVVPEPGAVLSSNSSISLRTPGSPMPRLRLVE